MAQRDDINQDQKSAIFLHRVDDIEANSIVVFDTRKLTASGRRTPPSWVRRMAVKGFTLTELMVTIAIVAIITAFAIPAFSLNSPSMEANELLGALQYARFAAIKNAQFVIVCPLASGSTPKCSTGSTWNTGWLVFAPAAATASCASVGGGAADVVLKTQSGFGSTDTATFTAGSGGSNTSICFNRMGFVPASSTGLVTIKTSPSKVKQERCVAVSGVGHMQVLSNGQTDINQVQCQ